MILRNGWSIAGFYVALGLISSKGKSPGKVRRFPFFKIGVKSAGEVEAEIMINANVICASPKQYQAKPQSNIPIPSLCRPRPQAQYVLTASMQKSARIFKCDRTANVSGNRDGMVPFSQTRLGERIRTKKGWEVDRNPLRGRTIALC